MLRYLLNISLVLGVLGWSVPGAVAQGTIAPEQLSKIRDEYKRGVNSNTITIIGSGLSGGNIKIVDDIAKTVNDGQDMRVLPVLGEGSSQNIRDLLYLRGIDAGTVKLGSVESYERDPLFSNLRQNLQYIVVLGVQEFHIVGTPNLNSLEDLAGKDVGAHGGALVAMKDLFRRLNLKPGSLKKVNFFKGLDAVKNGELDAIARVTASPMKKFDQSFDPKFHKIIPVPYSDALIEDFLPGTLTHETYPNVVEKGRAIETVASPVALVAYAWQPGTERYRRLAKFTNAFFSNFAKLLAEKNRHPSWDQVNLFAELPKWKRFPPAQEWLQKNKAKLEKQNARKRSNDTTAELESSEGHEKLRDELAAFLRKNGDNNISPAELNSLYNRFLKWRSSHSN